LEEEKKKEVTSKRDKERSGNNHSIYLPILNMNWMERGGEGGKKEDLTGKKAQLLRKGATVS